MKKALFILMVTVASSTTLLKAQGNLQFNQILTYSVDTFPNKPDSDKYGNPIGYSGDRYKVPAGKVWKINYFNIAQTSQNNFFVNINNVDAIPVYYNYPTYTWNNGGATTILGSPTTSPSFWLKANDILKVHTTSSIIPEIKYFISLTEYNIIP